MQEYKENNGSVTREFFGLREGHEVEDLRKKYEEAMTKHGDTIVEIKQKRIDRDDFCPCGSGKIFKRCCEKKMNGG